MFQASLFPASPSALQSPSWVPTRAAGLARLHAFVPHAGRAYARDRNVDRGPSDRSNVSALSPWIRRRLITEEEVVQAVLAQHSFAAAEKFIQEVCWRSYWKGWLEMRPELLRRFDAERQSLAQSWRGNADMSAARAGHTGIACFDAWVRELIETGWLHNHARMWFASIWIFTLGLPWQLGADFFYKHLLDADPASNTLSWRWVAGLHSRGKHYVARASNIRDNTLGRFDPRGDLNEAALPLDPDWLPPLAPLPHVPALSARTVAVLLTEEDLHAESWGLAAQVAGIAALPAPPVAAPGSPAAQFSAGALADGLARAGRHFGAPTTLISEAEVSAWAERLGVDAIVTGYAPTGLIAWQLARLDCSVPLHQLRRTWDDRLWPHATAGFFKLKERIPTVINAITAGR
jgi:deoxyribodipyrimidine photo-lyase